ncbi:phosphotransferase [Sporosalibacterium faouarense]|uniref:phosphotransferase n=1 Tax=Sporosalibacterium faouarense TaxID=516123 RepID=UPI00192B76E5|nr:phosphotransferase [Sporosalibacterium faouarense]
MGNEKYNIQMKKLCYKLELGALTEAPKEISGGLLHKMFCIKTTKGKYAIKALNPQIMLRPTAMKNYINSERIADIAANHIPALPAKIIDGTFIHEMDSQFYLVFDWIKGRSIRAKDITLENCKKIGTILAKIHKIDYSDLDIIYEKSDYEKLIDWKYYMKKGKEENAVWSNLIQENLNRLYELNDRVNKSEIFLSSNVVISHRDLDPKNVMWNEDNPIIIDWEASGYINPMKEMIETAIYWSEDESGHIDKERFLAFISEYKKIYGELNGDWKVVLSNGFSGKLGWLEYSLKRSLLIECTDEEEQKLGTDEVIETMQSIINYSNEIPVIEEWLNGI